MINVRKWENVIEKDEKELEHLKVLNYNINLCKIYEIRILIFKEREKECRKQIENAEHDLQNLHEKRAVIKDKLRTQTKGMRSNSTQHF